MQVTANGSDIGGTNDHCHYVYDKVTGNFEAVADFTRLDFIDRETKACIMARDSVAPGSRTVVVGFTAIVPAASTNRVVLLARTNSNGTAFAFGDLPQLNDIGWLRLTRTNTVFRAYYGTNGVDWIACGAVTNGSFGSTLHVGLAVTSHTNGHDTVAAVNQFGLAGDRPGTGVVPTMSVNIVSNQLVAKWQRTPRDFSVQVTDSLTGSSSSGTNSPPDWTFVLLPVFDTTLTGTNAFMPTAGRYMTIPLNLFTNNSMFVRLAQVDRVIPDPLGVTPGMILSQASGNMSAYAPPGNFLGGFLVNPSGAVTIPTTNYLSAGPGYSYTFNTTESTNLNTVLVVKKYISAGASTAIATNAGVGNAGKAKITFGTSTSITNYTAILAATNGFTPSACSPLRLRIDFN
jgi:hypothetical protein